MILLCALLLNYLTFSRARIVRWCAESNRPIKLVDDREFHSLMKAGRPGTSIPSQKTVSRDIHLAFEKCRLRVDQILQVRHRFDLLNIIDI